MSRRRSRFWREGRGEGEEEVRRWEKEGRMMIRRRVKEGRDMRRRRIGWRGEEEGGMIRRWESERRRV